MIYSLHGLAASLPSIVYHSIMLPVNVEHEYELQSEQSSLVA